MKRMSLVCLLLLSAIVIFAGGQQEKTGGKVTLRIAHSLGEGDNTAGPYFVPMLKKWAAEHAGQVELLEETTARSDDMATKLYVQLAGGDLPDVMYLVGGGARLGPLVQGNVLLDINNYLKETKALKREDIYEGAWNLYTIDGVLYGVPTSRYVMGWLVNSDIFKKYGLAYPQTYEEMVKQAGVFKNNGLVPLADGSIQGNPSHFLFSEVQAQFKGGLEEINSIAQTKKFNTAVTLKTAQLFEQMRKNGLFPQDTMANGGWGPSYTLYNESKAAMCYTATWMYGDTKPEVAKATDFINGPKMPGWTRDPATFIGGGAVYGFLANKKSYNDPKKHTLMIDLMDFLSSDKMFNELVKGGTIPSKKQNIDMSALPALSQKALAFYKDHQLDSCHFWNIADTEANNAFMYGLDELWAGTITAQGFLEKVQEALDKAK